MLVNTHWQATVPARTVLLELTVLHQAQQPLLVLAHVLPASILQQDLHHAQIALQALFLLLRVQDLVHLVQQAALTKQKTDKRLVMRALHVAR